MASILSKEFFRKMTPRLNQLSPELKDYFLKSIEENMSRLIAEGKRLEEIKGEVESLFAQYTTIIEILEKIALETEITLQAQIPLVIPAIFKRIHTGASFDPTRLEHDIRELFTKIRMFEGVLREQKINMGNFSVSIPEISQIIDEAPMEGFREAIKKALLKIERRRSHGLLKTVLTNPLKIPLYSFLNPHNAVATQKVVQSSPQLALSAPEAILTSKQPPRRTYYNAYYGQHFLSDVQPPPIVTKYKALSEANAETQNAAQKEYWANIIMSSNPEQQERDFLEVLKKGQLDIFTLILNAGVNPNNLRSNPLESICNPLTANLSNDIRLQLISILCSPQAEQMPNIKLPDTIDVTEVVTQSEYRFIENLLNRVFYKFGPIYLICARNNVDISIIDHFTHLPIHTEGNPYLIAVQQIQQKLETSVETILRRIDEIVNLLPRFQTPIKASITLTIGDKVWAHIDDRWKEMAIAGEELDDDFWPIAPIGAPVAQAVPVKYTEIRFVQGDDFRNKQLYDKLKSDLIRITGIIKSTTMFINGINVDEPGQYNITAFVYACERGDISLVSYLTELGANINIQYGNERTTPLIDVVNRGQLELVQLLCSNPSINLGLTNRTGKTALAYALNIRQHTQSTEENIFNIIQILIQAGSTPTDLFGTEQETALNLAVQRRELPTIEYLLNLHLSPSQTNARGVSPLMYASKRGSLPIVRLLVEHGADIDAIDNEGESALFYAVSNSNSINDGFAIEIVKYLVKKGINFKEQNDDGLDIYKRAEAFIRNHHFSHHPNPKNLLLYLAKLLGCVGGVCRAVGIEGFGPNANTRRRRAAAAAAPQAEAALVPVAPAGGARRKRITKKKGRRRSRGSR